MSDFNKVILLGRIGNELELKDSAQGKKYLKLSVATNNYRAGEEPTTYWHRVMVFGTLAEHCATYLEKGSQVMIEGHLEVRNYTDKDDRKISSVSVIANRVQFISRSGKKAYEKELDLADLAAESA